MIRFEIESILFTLQPVISKLGSICMLCMYFFFNVLVFLFSIILGNKNYVNKNIRNFQEQQKLI